MSDIYNPVWRRDLGGADALARQVESGEARIPELDSQTLIKLRDYCQIVVGSIDPRRSPEDYRRAVGLLDKVLEELRDRQW
ncbi:MAG: hypothetical protein HY678_02865 [Chloroflexi bacterium]|nr:hypothetical protein [Chloroflexota bacterium]